MTDNADDVLFNLPGNPNKLNRKSTYNLISSLLPAFISKEISARDTFKLFKDRGFKVGFAKFDELYQDVKRYETGARRIQFYDKDKLISRSILQEARYQITDKYRFVAELTLVTDVESQFMTQPFVIDVGSLTSISELENRVLQLFIDKYLGREDDIVQVQIIKGYKRPKIT